MLKTKRIGLIVTEDEKMWVIQLANIEGGLSQAALIRRLINKAAVEHNLSNFIDKQVTLEEKPNE